MAEIKDYLAANEVGVEDRSTLYNAFEILREEFGIDVEYDARLPPDKSALWALWTAFNGR